MARKPNYRLDRAERTRSKAAKKLEKLEAKTARRMVNCDVPTSTTEGRDDASAESSEEHDGFERADEKKG